MAVLDSGCAKTVCSKIQLNCYLEPSSSEEPKFGNVKVCHSIERITISAVIAGQNLLLTTEIIINDILLLLSKSTKKKSNTD